MAKGHVYHHKASEDGCAKRGCMAVLGIVLIAFAIRGCWAVLESYAPERQARGNADVR